MYVSSEGLLKRLYWPFAFLFSGVVLVWCVKLQFPITLVYLLMKPMWIISPFLIIAIGAWGLSSAIASSFLKLPRMTLTTDGIKLERFLSTWFIAWTDLGPFELPLGRDVKAKILSGRYKSKGILLIPNLDIEKVALFNQLNEWRANAISGKTTEQGRTV